MEYKKTRLAKIIEEQRHFYTNRRKGKVNIENSIRLKSKIKVNAYSIAKLLDIGKTTAYDKIKKNTFTYDEMIQIKKYFFPHETIDELFSYTND